MQKVEYNFILWHDLFTIINIGLFQKKRGFPLKKFKAGYLLHWRLSNDLRCSFFASVIKNSVFTYLTNDLNVAASIADVQWIRMKREKVVFVSMIWYVLRQWLCSSIVLETLNEIRQCTKYDVKRYWRVPGQFDLNWIIKGGDDSNVDVVAIEQLSDKSKCREKSE